ncbi:MAG: replication-associated recombination protein A [Verrucomicrobiota bacterium]
MDDFFEQERASRRPQALGLDAPLATRMRPRTLQEYVGQAHLLSKGSLLLRALEADRLSSMIFYGPPGTGKTSLARVIAAQSKRHFIELSGVGGAVADLRKAMEVASQQARVGKRTLLFIDEIHRLNKAQQDALLPDVERGTLLLIGATTQNPFFSVIAPLLSRVQVFELKPLREEDLVALQHQTLQDKERGLGGLPITLEQEAARHLATMSDGDARKCLNALEIAASTTPFNEAGRIVITQKIAEESIQQKAVVYDRTGDGHYDVVSAFIKSIRGSDPDAALYWLATMLQAGEDPRFIVRRLVILASEDIGLADAQALPLAIAAQQAVEAIGLPEARITLAHVTVYLALAPKSNSSYLALERAAKEVAAGRSLPVPSHLRDGHYPGAKNLGHGKNYLYPHDFPGAYVRQIYLAEPRSYYIPTEYGAEEQLIKKWRLLKKEIDEK